MSVKLTVYQACAKFTIENDSEITIQFLNLEFNLNWSQNQDVELQFEFELKEVELKFNEIQRNFIEANSIPIPELNWGQF